MNTAKQENTNLTHAAIAPRERWEDGFIAFGFVSVMTYLFLLVIVGSIYSLFIKSQLGGGILLLMPEIPMISDFLRNSLVGGVTKYSMDLWVIQANQAIVIKSLHMVIAALSISFGAFIGYLAYKPQKEKIWVSGNRILEGKLATRTALYQLDVTQENKGYSIGDINATFDRETKHAMILGKTGAGKTTVFLPLIAQAINRGDRVIIHDAKGGDFVSKFYDSRDSLLLGVWDKRGAVWEVSKDVRDYETASEFSKIIVPVLDKNDFFITSAQNIFLGILVYLMNEKTHWGWGDIYEMLKTDGLELRGKLIKHEPTIQLALPLDTGGAGGGLATSAGDVLSTLASSASGLVRVLAEAEKSNSKRFCVDDLLNSKSKIKVIILNGNGKYSKIQGKLFSLIIESMKMVITSPDYKERKPYAPGFWFFLDEFPQLGKMEQVKTLLEVGRSKGIRVVMGLQSISQLKEIYNQDAANTIMGLPQTYIYASLDNNSAKFISEMSGEAEYKVWSASGYSSPQKMQAIKPNDISDLRQDKIGVEVYVSFLKDIYKIKVKHSNFPHIADEYIKADWIKNITASDDETQEAGATKKKFASYGQKA